MPQLQLPMFPAGVTEINTRVAVEAKDGRVCYIHGALVNKVVFALMSGLPFKTSFKNGVELVKGFLDAAIDLVPAAVFQ